VCTLALVFGVQDAFAQTADSTQTEGQASSQTEAEIRAGETETEAKGNVEFEWKVEEGEKAQEGESGEKGGTEDINIGVGELQEGDPDRPVIQGNVPGGTEAQVQQYNETDIEFLAELVNPVAVSAVEVRGWNPEKKQEFLRTVKAHAEVQSEQDLQNFATGILLQDENVQEVRVEQESTQVAYLMPAKLFGFISGTLAAKSTVDAEGRVKVQFPWYRVFYRLSQEAQASSLEAHLASELELVSQKLDLQTHIGVKTEILATIVASLKTKHDLAVGQ
jgi:hypothetical protein